MSDGGKPRNGFSIHSRAKSFTFAFRGIAYLVRSEHNAWLHLLATVGAVAAGLLLRIAASDWRWLALAIALVRIAEAFNTAIERLCDVVSPDFDVRIGQAKDVAAGGVPIAAILRFISAAQPSSRISRSCALLFDAQRRPSTTASAMSS